MKSYLILAGLWFLFTISCGKFVGSGSDERVYKSEPGPHNVQSVARLVLSDGKRSAYLKESSDAGAYLLSDKLPALSKSALQLQHK